MGVPLIPLHRWETEISASGLRQSTQSPSSFVGSLPGEVIRRGQGKDWLGGDPAHFCTRRGLREVPDLGEKG